MNGLIAKFINWILVEQHDIYVKEFLKSLSKKDNQKDINEELKKTGQYMKKKSQINE